MVESIQVRNDRHNTQWIQDIYRDDEGGVNEELQVYIADKQYSSGDIKYGGKTASLICE